MLARQVRRLHSEVRQLGRCMENMFLASVSLKRVTWVRVHEFEGTEVEQIGGDFGA